jgi:hypothetical protein
MSLVKTQHSGSVVVVESNESADIFQLPLTVNSSCRVGSGTSHDWLFSVRLPKESENDEGFLREV